MYRALGDCDLHEAHTRQLLSVPMARHDDMHLLLHGELTDTA